MWFTIRIRRIDEKARTGPFLILPHPRVPQDVIDLLILPLGIHTLYVRLDDLN
jgi:hypothetical protein